MRKLFCLALVLGLMGSAYAELQNVVVGGEIRIRGRFWNNSWASTPFARTTLFDVAQRPIGPFGMTSRHDWDERFHDLKFVEQRTVLNVCADFTDSVSAFIEFEDYARWGEDFRSNYVTGVDMRANTADDVELLQAYINVDKFFGQPLRVRIGRQKIRMGKAWLVGSMAAPTRHHSYDAVRLTYTPGDFTVDAWWAKLAEMSPIEQDGDVDFYGVYGTYSGIEQVSLSAYWTLVRDAGRNALTGGWPPREWAEDLFGVDQYDVTNIHTVGIRLFGGWNALDYDLEVAYQFGEADSIGFTFPQGGILGMYGDSGAEYDHWASDLEIGYTLDVAWQPRFYIGGAYFQGEDKRDLTFAEWINPFDRADASVSFNRLFSAVWYSSLLDIVGGASCLTNFWQARAGVTAHPLEAVDTGLSVAYYEVDEPFDWPAYWTLPNIGNAVPHRWAILPIIAPWTEKADDEIGWITHLWVKYQYSADLWFKVGWEHLFTGDGLADGNFTNRNGLELNGGTDDDDADYFYFDTMIKF